MQARVTASAAAHRPPSAEPPLFALHWLTVVAVAATTVQAYLVLNKLWIRKHERTVAESVSIMGEVLGLVPLTILTVAFFAQGAWEGVVDGVVWIVAGTVTIAIGTGRWVEGRRKLGLWPLLRDAIRLERDEVGDLARSFFRPSGAGVILEILAQMALIDRHLDARERSFVDAFAEAWGIDFSWDELLGRVGNGAPDYVKLRRGMQDYLRTSPPPAQVSQLGDVLAALVAIDDETTDEEDLVLEELQGMVATYVDQDAGAERWSVAIVPQNPEQDAAITTLLPDVPKREVEGGLAYLLGPYHSARYADLIGDQYRSLAFFTTVVRARARASLPLEEDAS